MEKSQFISTLTQQWRHKEKIMNDRLSIRLAAGAGPTFGVDDLACAAATSISNFGPGIGNIVGWGEKMLKIIKEYKVNDRLD